MRVFPCRAELPPSGACICVQRWRQSCVNVPPILNFRLECHLGCGERWKVPNMPFVPGAVERVLHKASLKGVLCDMYLSYAYFRFQTVTFTNFTSLCHSVCLTPRCKSNAFGNGKRLAEALKRFPPEDSKVIFFA